MKIGDIVEGTGKYTFFPRGARGVITQLLKSSREVGARVKRDCDPVEVKDPVMLRTDFRVVTPLELLAEVAE